MGEINFLLFSFALVNLQNHRLTIRKKRRKKQKTPPKNLGCGEGEKQSLAAQIPSYSTTSYGASELDATGHRSNR